MGWVGQAPSADPGGFWRLEGDNVSRRSSGKKEGSRPFGRRSTDLSRALRIFETKLGDNILKK